MPVTITYTNWKGEVSVRRIIPRRVWFGKTEWHPDAQWFLEAFDLNKNEERTFAMRDISNWN